MKSVTAKNSGSLLVVMMIILTVFSTASIGIVGSISRDIFRINNDYFDLVAYSAAESGIELAKNDLFPGSKLGNSQNAFATFAYGSEHFPEISGRIVKCRVTANVHPDKIFIESNAQVFQKRDGQKDYQVLSEKTVKKLIKLTGSLPTITTIWHVSN